MRKMLRYCEVFKNTYFEKHLWTAASENQHLSNKISCPEVFCKKGVLRNFAKFTGKHLHQNLFFNNLEGLGPWYCCLPVNSVKFRRTPFLIEHLWWPLLQIYQRLQREVISNFLYPFKSFSILNFGMTEWFYHVQAHRNETNSRGVRVWSLSKNVDHKKIIQLKLFKMPRNNE